MNEQLPAGEPQHQAARRVNQVFMPDQKTPEQTEHEIAYAIRQRQIETARAFENFPGALGIALAPLAEAVNEVGLRLGALCETPEFQRFINAASALDNPVDLKAEARRRSRNDLQKKRRELYRKRPAR